MNGKQAKRLRKAALGLVTTMTEAGKDIKKDGYVAKKHDKTVMVSSMQEGVEVKTPTKQSRHQILVKPDSCKAIYKQLKKQVARA
jgi:DNA-binding transcriptional regulator YhcF (GntR family)